MDKIKRCESCWVYLPGHETINLWHVARVYVSEEENLCFEFSSGRIVRYGPLDADTSVNEAYDEFEKQLSENREESQNRHVNLTLESIRCLDNSDNRPFPDEKHLGY